MKFSVIWNPLIIWSLFHSLIVIDNGFYELYTLMKKILLYKNDYLLLENNQYTFDDKNILKRAQK